MKFASLQEKLCIFLLLFSFQEKLSIATRDSVHFPYTKIIVLP